MVDKNNDKNTANALHGISDKKHHIVAFRNASLISDCRCGDNSLIVWIEFNPPCAFASARDSRSAGVRTPEATSARIYDFTLALRTAAHCARPTVPPNEE